LIYRFVQHQRLTPGLCRRDTTVAGPSATVRNFEGATLLGLHVASETCNTDSRWLTVLPYGLHRLLGPRSRIKVQKCSMNESPNNFCFSGPPCYWPRSPRPRRRRTGGRRRNSRRPWRAWRVGRVSADGLSHLCSFINVLTPRCPFEGRDILCMHHNSPICMYLSHVEDDRASCFHREIELSHSSSSELLCVPRPERVAPATSVLPMSESAVAQSAKIKTDGLGEARDSI
jgi:hypothetical protein